MTRRRTALLTSGFSMLLVAACAPPPLMRLPTEPGSPASDGAAVLADATAACARVSSMVAEASVTGSVQEQRVRATLHVGVAAPDSARLEAIAPFGRPLFTFVADDGRATLLLTRPDRVVADASPAALLEAVTGVPLDPAGLRAALTGCTAATTLEEVRRMGDSWRVGREGNTLRYFQRDGDRWRLAATVHREPGRPDWRAEYHEHAADGLPRVLRLASSDTGGFNLRLGLSQVEIDIPLEASAFELRVPAGAESLTLEELRGGAVLSDVADDGDADAR